MCPSFHGEACRASRGIMKLKKQCVMSGRELRAMFLGPHPDQSADLP